MIELARAARLESLKASGTGPLLQTQEAEDSKFKLSQPGLHREFQASKGYILRFVKNK